MTAQYCEISCSQYELDLQSVHVKDKFICGLYNESLQTDILAEAAYLASLEYRVTHPEGFESALCNQVQLHNLVENAARISEYNESKIPNMELLAMVSQLPKTLCQRQTPRVNECLNSLCEI